MLEDLESGLRDYLMSLNGREDPPGSLLTATRETETMLLEKYRRQVGQNRKWTERKPIIVNTATTTHESEPAVAVTQIVDAPTTKGIDKIMDQQEIISSSTSQAPAKLVSHHTPKHSNFGHSQSHVNEKVYIFFLLFVLTICC